MMINVQYADNSEKVIVSYFSGPQDVMVYPNQGAIETSDSRWAAFYDSQSVLIQSLLPSPAGS